jgi:hypothetical protein
VSTAWEDFEPNLPERPATRVSDQWEDFEPNLPERQARNVSTAWEDFEPNLPERPAARVSSEWEDFEPNLPERQAQNVSDSDADFERSLLASEPTRDVPDVRLRRPADPIARAAPELSRERAPLARSTPELADPLRIANLIEAEDLPQTARQEIEGPETDNPAERQSFGKPPGAGADAGHSGGRSPHRKAQIALGIAQMLGGILELGGAASGRTGLQLAGAGIGQVGGAMAQAQGARAADEAQSKLRQNALDVTAGNHLDSLKEQARGEERQLGRDAIGDQRYADEQALEAERYGDTQERQSALDAAALARDAATQQYRADELDVRRLQSANKTARSGAHAGVRGPTLPPGTVTADPNRSYTVLGQTFTNADIDQLAQAHGGYGDTAHEIEQNVALARRSILADLAGAEQMQAKNQNGAANIIRGLVTRAGAVPAAPQVSQISAATVRATRDALPLEAVGFQMDPGRMPTAAQTEKARVGYFGATGLADNLESAANISRRLTPEQLIEASTKTARELPAGSDIYKYRALIDRINAQYRNFNNWGVPQEGELRRLEEMFPAAGIQWGNITGASAGNMAAMADQLEEEARQMVLNNGYSWAGGGD